MLRHAVVIAPLDIWHLIPLLLTRRRVGKYILYISRLSKFSLYVYRFLPVARPFHSAQVCGADRTRARIIPVAVAVRIIVAGPGALEEDTGGRLWSTRRSEADTIVVAGCIVSREEV